MVARKTQSRNYGDMDEFVADALDWIAVVLGNRVDAYDDEDLDFAWHLASSLASSIRLTGSWTNELHLKEVTKYHLSDSVVKPASRFKALAREALKNPSFNEFHEGKNCG